MLLHFEGAIKKEKGVTTSVLLPLLPCYYGHSSLDVILHEYPGVNVDAFEGREPERAVALPEKISMCLL